MTAELVRDLQAPDVPEQKRFRFMLCALNCVNMGEFLYATYGREHISGREGRRAWRKFQKNRLDVYVGLKEEAQDRLYPIIKTMACR